MSKTSQELIIARGGLQVPALQAVPLATDASGNVVAGSASSTAGAAAGYLIPAGQTVKVPAGSFYLMSRKLRIEGRLELRGRLVDLART